MVKEEKESWNWLYLVVILMVLLSMGKCAQGQTVETVRAEIIAQGIQHPDIVLAQAIKESGWFKCTNCSLDGNNVFGFYWKGDYKSWDTWQEGVFYYATWQKKWYKGGDYFEFLTKKGYAEDPDYVKDLKNTYPLNQKNEAKVTR